jgi:hypothetical protein
MHDVVQGKTRRRTPSDDKGIEKKRSADRERQRKRLQKMTTQELSEYRASQCAKALKQRQSMTQEDKALAAIRRHKNYMDNHDHQKATHREWHLRNKDSVLVLQKKWRAHRANLMKGGMTAAEHRSIADWMEGYNA